MLTVAPKEEIQRQARHRIISIAAELACGQPLRELDVLDESAKRVMSHRQFVRALAATASNLQRLAVDLRIACDDLSK